ncbi:hypothetical protein GCM10023159_16520 [Brevibacterium yomogidense]
MNTPNTPDDPNTPNTPNPTGPNPAGSNPMHPIQAGDYAAHPGEHPVQPGAYPAQPGVHVAQPGAYPGPPGTYAAQAGAYSSHSGAPAASPGGFGGPPMGPPPGTSGYPGGGFQSQPRPPRSEPGGPARTLEVSSTSRVFMRSLVAVIGALALLVPASALAYTGVGLAGLVREETSYDLPTGVSSLAVSADTATVEVSVSDELDSPRVRHVYQGRDVDVQPPTIGEAGGEATIDMPRSTESRRWWAPNAGMENTLHVELPADYARELDLDVTTRWGFTEVNGQFANVSAESEAGAIRIDVTAGDVSAKTRAGFVDASGAMDTLTLDTSTGYIETSTVDVARSLSAKTNAGGIDLGLGENAVPRDGLEAHAQTGSVDIGLPQESRVRDLAGYSVNATAGSGMVDVDVAQATGDDVVPVTVSAASGSVHIFYLDDFWDSGDSDDGDADSSDSDISDSDTDTTDSGDVDAVWDEAWDEVRQDAS